MRYPFLYKIEDAPNVSHSHRVHLRRVANSVCNRTGLHACYNRKNGSILFHHGDEFGGPLKLDAFHPDGNERKWLDHEIDDAVEWIKRGYISREAKDRIAQRNEWLEECDRQNAIRGHAENRRPDAVSVLNFNDRKRRGVQKVISA